MNSLSDENSSALLTVWRVVIEKCVTVVWLKQFSVARCVTCCYWKGCIGKELALEFKKDILSSYALVKRTPMHARHVDERGVMTIWILISGGDGVSTSVVSVHKVTLGSDATFVGSRCDWPGDICSVYAQQCILNSRWRHATHNMVVEDEERLRFIFVIPKAIIYWCVFSGEMFTEGYSRSPNMSSWGDTVLIDTDITLKSIKGGGRMNRYVWKTLKIINRINQLSFVY